MALSEVNCACVECSVKSFGVHACFFLYFNYKMERNLPVYPQGEKKHVTGFDQSYLSPTRYDWCHVGPQESVLAEEMKRSQMLRSSEFNLYYHCYSAKQDNRRITFCLS